jgi:hypothetical protein
MDLDQGRDILPPGERPDVQSADDADAADAKTRLVPKIMGILLKRVFWRKTVVDPTRISS